MRLAVVALALAVAGCASQRERETARIREVQAAVDADIAPCRATWSGTGGVHLSGVVCPDPPGLQESIAKLAQEHIQRSCPGMKLERVPGEAGTAPHHYRCTTVPRD